MHLCNASNTTGTALLLPAVDCLHPFSHLLHGHSCRQFQCYCAMMLLLLPCISVLCFCSLLPLLPFPLPSIIVIALAIKILTHCLTCYHKHQIISQLLRPTQQLHNDIYHHLAGMAGSQLLSSMRNLAWWMTSHPGY